MMQVLQGTRGRSVGQVMWVIRMLRSGAVLLGAAGGLLCSPLLLSGCGILAAAVLAYGMLCWRCPFCRSAMDPLCFSPGRICPSCGTELKADSPL